MAKPTESNQGIIISGGQVTFTQAVAGRGAQAHFTDKHTANPAAPASPELLELRKRLDDLSAAMAQSPSSTQGRHIEALDGARAEAAKDKPNVQRIKDLMSVVAEGAKSVVSVTGAIQAVASLVACL